MHDFSHSPTFQPVWRLYKSGANTAQLLPPPGVTRHPNLSGASVHSPSGCVPPLCVSYFISTSPSDFQHPSPSWCWAALPAVVGDGAGDLTLLYYPEAGTTWGAAAALVPAQIPGTLLSQHTLLTVCFSMSSTIFCLQTSYKLGIHWLFTLFLGRLARCSIWTQGELGSGPTYLAAIFLFSMCPLCMLLDDPSPLRREQNEQFYS